jgi:hypothetical protein|tara:strand:- start:292 stop:495 length:204 start_codon:yes stop_codon:yes gene_type:complete
MKKQKKINLPPKENYNSVYVFYNNMFDFNIYINATHADDAMEKFDQCGFEHRSNWKIMVELNNQPSD